MTPASAGTGDAGTATQPAAGTSSTPSAATATTSDGDRPPSTGSSDSTQTSSSSSPPSGRSRKQYKRPTTVRALTAQIVEQATRVINGDVSDEELDELRLYSNLTRTAAQLVSTEVQHARMDRRSPDLTLEDIDE